ncbi:alpha/beta fold hydrolase [Halobacteriovorax sp. HLS]|uniref:alpha/beta fold hydrolase n=1 Tax=Halobacteriovorax sp. HLS TaxID=2234000 RepID=UPI0013E3340A|nr:alpha/beta fold hydrolase [Halobacteriovorax sp. HLS]
MSIKIIKSKLSYLDQTINAMVFIPSEDRPLAKSIAVFTHGYTSHKASILSWCTRLAEEGVANIVFDLPGHYLGSYNEVSNFEMFTSEAPKLFIQAKGHLEEVIGEQSLELQKHFTSIHIKTVLGGHSLGALLSLIALEGDFFSPERTQSVCVGLGMPPEGVTHIFDTPFYKSTLNVRRQLVSSAISPEKIFPWIKERKEKLKLSGRRIHFITGSDDVVVGKEGSEIMRDYLIKDNEVTVDRPNKIPHHMPELAAPHIKKYLKDQGLI